jgi:hypothetical protein
MLDPWSGGAGINATLGADITFNPLRPLVANTFQIRGKEGKRRQRGSLSDILYRE